MRMYAVVCILYLLIISEVFIMKYKGRLTLSLPIDLMEKLDDYCEKNDTTKSKVVGDLVKDFLKSKK